MRVIHMALSLNPQNMIPLPVYSSNGSRPVVLYVGTLLSPVQEQGTAWFKNLKNGIGNEKQKLRSLLKV